jgi:hypothetical protein
VRKIAGNRLRIGPIEAIDGTPVVDITPSLHGLAQGSHTRAGSAVKLARASSFRSRATRRSSEPAARRARRPLTGGYPKTRAMDTGSGHELAVGGSSRLQAQLTGLPPLPTALARACSRSRFFSFRTIIKSDIGEHMQGSAL